MERTLRLTLEYDGARVRRLGAAARPPHHRGHPLRRARGALARLVRDARRRGTHRCGRARLASGRERRRRGRSATRADGRRPALACCRGISRWSRPTEAPSVFHARFSALARRYEYRVLARRPRAPLRADRVLHHASPIDRAALDRVRLARRRRARLRSFHADGDAGRAAPAPRDLLRAGARRATSWCSRSRPTRSCTTWCGRSSGRCCRSRATRAPSTRSHGCSGARRARSPGRRRRRTRSTLTGVRYAGDVPDGDHIRCYVTRERAGARELLVLEQDAGGPTLPDGGLRARASGSTSAARTARCGLRPASSSRAFRARSA